MKYKTSMIALLAVVTLQYATPSYANGVTHNGDSITSDDTTGHDKSNERINIAGDVQLEKDVTLGNWVTLHDGAKVTGNHKMTVKGYLTVDGIGSGGTQKDLKGVDISGIDLRIEQGTPSSTNEGELIIGQNKSGKNLTVGNVEMASGTNLYLYKPGQEHYLKIADGKTLTFEQGEHRIYGGKGEGFSKEGTKLYDTSSLTIKGKGGTVVNKGNVKTNVDIDFTNVDYIADNGWLGRETYDTDKTELTFNFSGGNVVLDNKSRLIALHSDYGKSKWNENGTINLMDNDNIIVKNGSTIDAVDLFIAGKTDAGKRVNVYIGGDNAYILGYGETEITDANILIDDGGSLIQGLLGNGSNAKTDAKTMHIEDSNITVNRGGVLRSTISQSAAGAKSRIALGENTVVDLYGRIEGIVESGVSDSSYYSDIHDDSGTINVLSSDAYIESILKNKEDKTRLKELNIFADTSNSKLFGDKVVLNNMNIQHGYTFTLDGDKTFKARDIFVRNGGTLRIDPDADDYTVKSTDVVGTLDLGTSNYVSDVTAYQGSVVKVGVKSDSAGTIYNGKIDADNGSFFADGDSSLVVVVDDDVNLNNARELDLGAISDELTDSESNLHLVDNLVYDLELDQPSGKVLLSKNTTDRVASKARDAGADAHSAGVMAAFANARGLNGVGQNIHTVMNDRLQHGDVNAVSELARDIAPSVAPVVQTVETNQLNNAYGAALAQLNDAYLYAMGCGLDNVSVWGTALAGTGTLDDDSGDIDLNTLGAAAGVQVRAARNLNLGLGYAYGNTDIDAHHRDIDVNSHTIMLYGQYRPYAPWFINAIASYGFADYDETRNSAFGNLDASYDVQTIGAQATTGYDFAFNAYRLTPQVGLRYTHLNTDSYTDDAGQNVDDQNRDIWTAMANVNFGRTFALENGMTIRPELNLGVTYDLARDDNDVIVNIGTENYRVSGESLARFGTELGVGVSFDLTNNLNLSAKYQGGFRKDFVSHTGLISARYKF